MKKFFKSKNAADSNDLSPDITSQIGAIKIQLDFLEKKIDALLSRSSSHQSGKPHFAHRVNRNNDRGFKNPRNNDFGFKGGNLTRTTCSECHTTCEIPFKPTGNRPVYCSNCFSKRKNDNPSNSARYGSPKKTGFETFFNKNKGRKQR
ncbi:MAG: CxxC-x17-CxxC domain-containing protein [bacterium]